MTSVILERFKDFKFGDVVKSEHFFGMVTHVTDSGNIYVEGDGWAGSVNPSAFEIIGSIFDFLSDD